MTVYEFAKNLWENMIDTNTTYTIEDAQQDISNFSAEDWDLPEELTAESLHAAMLEIMAENAE